MSNSNLDISVERPGGLEHRLTIRVPSADIEREIDARLQKVGRTARLKGFRPGKVPQKVVRRHYGGQVRQEVLSEVIRSSYSRAIQQEQLNPAGGPRIEALPGEDQEHFAFQAIFEVFPEVQIGDLGELEVERPRVEITDADVDTMMQKLREQRAEWREVERKSRKGDRVVVDFVGRLDGEPFEGGEAQEVTITVGAGQVIEDFDNALEGLGAGDEKTAQVAFPADYGVDTLAGRKAEFELKAHRVEEKVLPELSDEFAKLFGVEEGGVDALRVEVRNNMQRELDERLKNEVKTRVLDALLAANEVTTPKALVEDEIANLQQDAMRRMGIEDPSKAPPRERFEPAAKRRVAVGLLLQELIRANGIELDRPRVQRRIDELVAPYENPAEAAQVYRGSRELMAQVESSVLEDQVVEFMLERARVTDKDVGFDEFMQA
ncbi:MAG: trigger factor [Gammaproteobacteria bacterium]|nr:trigger factor [Gammaproteobacteria bacterium]